MPCDIPIENTHSSPLKPERLLTELQRMVFLQETPEAIKSKCCEAPVFVDKDNWNINHCSKCGVFLWPMEDAIILPESMKEKRRGEDGRDKLL